MTKPIEDYAFIGNTLSGALVATDGSIDWLCLPRFDGDACFAALLGGPEHGHWQICPADESFEVQRRYRPGTALLETTFRTATGTVTVIDCMPFAAEEHKVDVIRIVRGDQGCVDLRMSLVLRFGYGKVVPWVRHMEGGISAIAGPDAVQFWAPVKLTGQGLTTTGAFRVQAGESVPFTLAYRPSHWPERPMPDAEFQLAEAAARWQEWSGLCSFGDGSPPHWREAVIRSLITLKALTFQPTGGMVAAPTTSLPEHLGGVRNWDYRFCWIRDATLVLYAFLTSGYDDEALAWRAWLLRAVAGDPRQLQIMYGLAGERRLTETTLPWLPGYAGSQPVRLGNGAFDQRQLDVPGELMDTLHVGRKSALASDDHVWRLQKAILKQLEQDWSQPDEGIWEVRGGQRLFTQSRVMCWVAFDRGIKAVEEFGLDGPAAHWREVRETIRADILRHGWSEEKRSFVQYYGGSALDASLLLLAQVGFLSADDPRFVSTVAAIERELLVDGFVLRYRADQTPDGLQGDEGVFLACSFWLADAYVLMDRRPEAEALFERLLRVRNDVGLLAEEFHPGLGRQLGNFPQAFSHVALVNTANNLAKAQGPARQRAEQQSAGAEPPPSGSRGRSNPIPAGPKQ